MPLQGFRQVPLPGLPGDAKDWSWVWGAPKVCALPTELPTALPLRQAQGCRDALGTAGLGTRQVESALIVRKCIVCLNLCLHG